MKDFFLFIPRLIIWAVAFVATFIIRIFLSSVMSGLILFGLLIAVTYMAISFI